jgi:hypothetical protein
LRLPEVEPDIFQMYADWVYSNVVAPAYPSRAGTRSLIKLYLLGDFLDDIKLRTKTMELLVASVKTVNTFPSVDHIALIWNNTTAKSLLRTWMLISRPSTPTKQRSRGGPTSFLRASCCRLL